MTGDSRESGVRTTCIVCRSDFDRLVSEAVDQALTDLLGWKARQSVYTCLEEHYAIAKKQIPSRLSDFDSALVKMFGKSSRPISKIFAERLFSSLGLQFADRSSYEFLDYVGQARLATLAIPPE